MFDRAAFRYCINNPSAWESYDEGISEKMRAADNEIDRLDRELSAVRSARPISWLREVDAGTDNACWVVCAKGDPGSRPVFLHD